MAPAGAAFWPFWAPTETETVERALSLAGLRRGERFLDLGCGDGRTLVAAARRGACVMGVEGDARLADHAERALHEAGHDGEVRVGDFFDGIPEADVVFAYLSPATLQRLLPLLRLSLRPGGRLVSVEYAVPGLVAEASDAGCHLYRAPFAAESEPEAVGWEHRCSIVAAPAGRSTLVALRAFHPGGAVDVELTGDFAIHAQARAGANDVTPGTVVAFDVRWSAPGAPATATIGAIEVSGLPAHRLIGLPSVHERRFVHVGPRTYDALVPAILGWRPDQTVDGLLASVDVDRLSSD